MNLDIKESFEKTRIAGSIAAGALDEVNKIVKPGIITSTIDDLCYEFINDHGAYSAPLFYRGFPKSCCTSTNHIVCHGIPSNKILQEGDIQIRGFKLRLNLDIQFIFTANPEDYTNRGSIVTPLKDRIGSQILTHYPKDLETAKKITFQEIASASNQKNNIHIPEGNIKKEKINEYCSKYEHKIVEEGGIDFQLLGIGRTGHIGFNEPGSNYDSLTRLVYLDYLTRNDARKAFNGMENVPTTAITMGIKTIRKSKIIVLMAWGNNKSSVVKKAIEGDIDSNISASYLQNHKNVTFVLDKAASDDLTRVKSPWRTGSCKWTEKLKAKAVAWLCNRTNKSILNLTESDYNKNNLSELLLEKSYFHVHQL